MKLEFQRNRERYEFMKWGMQAFNTFGVVPPGFGIVHQVNLEYLARGVHRTADGVYYPDTLVGTDSHTTMINGIGVVGWGVGGIEAEAAMLGQPVYMLTPDVVGFELTGRLREGCTATDLVLTVTEILRRHKVVGKFVEFFGEGTRTLAVPDRATIGNMAPEYGATMGFFPVDEKTIDYYRGTGRTEEQIETLEAYFRAQGLFGVPLAGEIDYSQVVRLDLGDVTPSLAGPKRPQDRIELGKVARTFTSLFSKPIPENGFNQPAELLLTRHLVQLGGEEPDPQGAGQPADPAGRGALRDGDGGQQAHAGFGPVRSAVAPATRAVGGRHHRQWRRADRGHHQLHQHLQPRRAAGRRPAGQEGRGGGPARQAARQDLAGAGFAHRHRVLRAGRPAALPGAAGLFAGGLRLHHLHRQLGRPDARDQRGDHQERPGLRRGAVGQPQLRGAHPSQHQGQLPGQPAAGGGLRHRRHGAAGPDDRAGGPGPRRQGRLPGRHLADQRRDPQAHEVRAERQGLPRELRQGQDRAGRAVAGHPRGQRRNLHLAAQHLHRRAAVLPGLQLEPLAARPHGHGGAGARGGVGAGRAHHGAVRRLDHHRPHLARRFDQGKLAGRPVAAGPRRDEARLQQLRLAPRQP